MKNKWIIGSDEINDKEISLLCIPYAGASASLFAKWQSDFEQNILICPILLPFRDSRRKENMPESVSKLAMDFITENAELLTKPYAIFGHCTGAILGYEIARIAKKVYGVEPIFLIVSSSQQPAIVPEEAKVMCDADDAVIMEYLINENLVEKEILYIPEFIEYYFPILREDFRLYANYLVTKEKFKCPIIAMYDPNDSKIKEINILGWNQYTEQFRKIVVRGGHYAFLNNEKELISSINQIVNEVKRRKS